jgi:putative flippase GtrA
VRALRELAGYTAAAGLAFAVDIGLLYVLARLAGWHYLLAATVSFLCGTTLLYLLATTLVFRFRRLDSQTLEFGGFAAIGAVALLLNTTLLWVAVGRLGLPLLPAKVGVAGITFFANFALRRALLFTPRGVDAPGLEKRSLQP